MIEVRHAGLKGLGVFATNPIARGTRIFAERPLISVSDGSDVYSAYRRLSVVKQRSLMQLSTNVAESLSVLRYAQAAWRIVGQTSNHLSRRLFTQDNGTSDWPSIREHLAVQSIFRNNNFGLGDGVQALFQNIARINHACIPNVQANWNEAIQRFTVHTLRAIDMNEEITLSYLDEHGALRKSRQAKLSEGYGFDCDCLACDLMNSDSSDGESKRKAVQDLLGSHAAAIAVAQPVSGLSFDEPENVAVAEMLTAASQPSDQKAELRLTLALIDLFEDEGLAGRELATMYLTVATLNVQLGHSQEAVRYAQNGLQLDLDCVGVDSPLYLESHRAMEAIGLPTETLQ